MVGGLIYAGPVVFIVTCLLLPDVLSLHVVGEGDGVHVVGVVLQVEMYIPSSSPGVAVGPDIVPVPEYHLGTPLASIRQHLVHVHRDGAVCRAVGRVV